MEAFLIPVLFCLAVFRLTRFFIADSFPPIAWLRTKITGKKPDGHWLIYLFGSEDDTGCPWCMSIWVGGIAAILLGLFTDWYTWPMWVMLWLTASAVAGFLTQAED